MNSISLALLCKDGKGLSLMDQSFTVTEDNSITPTPNQLWRTDKWAMAEDKVKQLIGKNLAIVSKKGGTTYLGGEIVGYYPVENTIQAIPEFPLRYGLVFRENPTLKGLTIPSWKSRNPVFYVKEETTTPTNNQ